MKSYTGTTRTLESNNTSYRSVIFKPSKPPLDSELNFVGDLAHDLNKMQVRELMTSGFYPMDVNAFEIGYDNSGNANGVNLTDTPNQFIVRNFLGLPFKVNVSGEVLDVGGSNTSEQSKLAITLPPAPSSGSRQDLVFLEVWYQELFPNSLANRPESGKIYKFGNVQSGMEHLDDDIYYSPIGTDTTQRIQLQYRIRVVTGVNFSSFPEGINDTNNVKAQAGRGNTSLAYSFEKVLDDSGLYRAGNGDSSSISDLGTVDGYSYAIPLFRIHRRNASPFSLLNLNGAGKTIAQGNSDRPDGYFNDKIEIGDIEDLRHTCVVSINTHQLDFAFKSLLEGNLNTVLTESVLGADLSFNAIGLHVDGISTVDQTGALDIASPNGQRRVFSDADAVQKTIQRFSLTDRTEVKGINWTLGDQFNLNLLGSNPVGTIFGSNPLKVFAIVKSGPSESKVEIPSVIEPVGDTALIITLGEVPTGVSNQQLYVEYEIAYPNGNGLTFVPNEIKRIFEVRDNVNFSFVSENDIDGIRAGSLVSNLTAQDYRIGKNEKEGFTTLGFLQVFGDGTQSYTLPANYGTIPITHVHYITVSGTLISRSTSPLSIQQINQNFDNTITVIFNNAVPVNTPMVFGVGLANNAALIQEKTKSITNLSQIEILSKTILNGQNLTQVTIASTGIIYSAQSEKLSLSTYQDICYIDGLATPCTTTIDGNFITVQLDSPIGVSQNNTISITVNRSKALDSNQQLQIFYMFTPYQGVTAKQSFGNGVNSFVRTRLIDQARGFLVHTSGTNGFNSTVPDAYSPISVKLPKAFSDKDSDLGNEPLGAEIYPYHKGISLDADYTISGGFSSNDFEVLHDWESDNLDTTGIRLDDIRGMFLRPTLRFNKTGTSGSLVEISKETFYNDWSALIDFDGNVAAGRRLVYWVFIPDQSKVQNFSMRLVCDDDSFHSYEASNFVTGWNRLEFTSRTGGDSSSTSVVRVKFISLVNSPSEKVYGFNIIPPYLEIDNPNVVAPQDGEIWYGQKEQRIMKFLRQKGGYPLSDGAGINFFKNRAYSFDVPIVSGINDQTLTRVQPYVSGRENYISKDNVINNRGTFKGSNFYSVGMDTINSVKKQTVMFMLEQVLEDPTGNFERGEFVLRVETRMTTETSVEITNSDFSSTNSFDLFKIKGRPLGKL